MDDAALSDGLEKMLQSADAALLMYPPKPVQPSTIYRVPPSHKPYAGCFRLAFCLASLIRCGLTRKDARVAEKVSPVLCIRTDMAYTDAATMRMSV